MVGGSVAVFDAEILHFEPADAMGADIQQF